jgi:N-methylhydantoinase A/oxoprolinase/acetone carboxylase beta subunit
MPDYILGVDIGGTDTDGVLIHQDTKEIIHSNKTVTIREDLFNSHIVQVVLKNL